jgi:hypothetical protein
MFAECFRDKLHNVDNISGRKIRCGLYEQKDYVSRHTVSSEANALRPKYGSRITPQGHKFH